MAASMRAAVAAALAVIAVAGTARAERAAAACSAHKAGGRVVVGVELEGLFDKEMLRLVKLGLEGRVHVEVTLVRRRNFWFDARLGSQTKDIVVSYSKEIDRFVLGGTTPISDPGRLSLARLSLWPGEDGQGGYEVEVSAKLQVVTVSSLGKMASWIAGGGGKDAPRGVLSRNLVSAITNDLTRSATTTCKVD